MTLQLPPPDALTWLSHDRPRALARRLVAAGTHDPDTARLVETTVEECGAVWAAADDPATAVRRLLIDADVEVAALRQQALLTVAAFARRPLWTSDQPRPGIERTCRRLVAVELGTVRCIAKTDLSRLVPVALAEAGVIASEQAHLSTCDFRRHGAGFEVDVPAFGWGAGIRTVLLGPWATDGTAAHLDYCRRRGIRPCYRGHAAVAADRSKAVAARIDRVLAAADIPATAGSIRFTAGLQSLEQAGPAAAARLLGIWSVPRTLAYLNG